MISPNSKHHFNQRNSHSLPLDLWVLELGMKIGVLDSRISNLPQLCGLLSSFGTSSTHQRKALALWDAFIVPHEIDKWSNYNMEHVRWFWRLLMRSLFGLTYLKTLHRGTWLWRNTKGCKDWKWGYLCGYYIWLCENWYGWVV